MVGLIMVLAIITVFLFAVQWTLKGSADPVVWMVWCVAHAGFWCFASWTSLSVGLALIASLL